MIPLIQIREVLLFRLRQGLFNREVSTTRTPSLALPIKPPIKRSSKEHNVIHTVKVMDIFLICGFTIPWTANCRPICGVLSVKLIVAKVLHNNKALSS